MNTAKLFKNGNSQAVRLPKEYRFDADEIGVNKIGNMVILYPKDSAWDLFTSSLTEFTDDFMAERSQPKKADKRKPI
jgi:antitoxin VapB